MNRISKKLLGILSFMVLLSLACGLGVYTGSSAQQTAIALGKTQGAPAAMTAAAETNAASTLAAKGITATPTPGGFFEGWFEMPDLGLNPTPAGTPYPQVGFVTTKYGPEGELLWHWFQNQPGTGPVSEFFPGQHETAKGAGQIRSGVRLPVHLDASVEHYFGFKVQAWMEITDVDEAKLLTKCTKHDWGDHAGKEKELCHAHLLAYPQKDVNNIIGVVMPKIPVKILKRDEYNRMLFVELTSVVWLSSEQVENFEKFPPPPPDCRKVNCTFLPMIF
ncbi:hypothetical protein A2Z33_00390 [Candidatus Gottesmanbacteria bacterium RBG_16_52_11]|uniref:Uncharacterized protein n=1 Tax=Candidatus Gottesmanbacteria bacterium RBG_16_52_11 TaxID=1798374 RepID=A0A1F5YMQ7_9BACT|nr:MAG: hypothetical protein A2Z33_00390 [Candidatus Gottesmanbacteria bacterium RBG_16_52_11]